MVKFISLIVGIVICCIFGTITKNMNEEKGYYGGFAWGFWLGIIGIIVIACKPDARLFKCNEREEPKSSLWERQQEEEERLLRNGGWKCFFCNRTNPGYATMCACGRTKKESKDAQKNKNESIAVEKETDSLKIKLDNNKKMLDDGVITKEEYEERRKKILGI